MCGLGNQIITHTHSLEHLTMLEAELLLTASVSGHSLQLLVPEKQWWMDGSIRMTFAL